MSEKPTTGPIGRWAADCLNNSEELALAVITLKAHGNHRLLERLIEASPDPVRFRAQASEWHYSTSCMEKLGLPPDWRAPNPALLALLR